MVVRVETVGRSASLNMAPVGQYATEIHPVPNAVRSIQQPRASECATVDSRESAEGDWKGRQGLGWTYFFRGIHKSLAGEDNLNADAMTSGIGCQSGADANRIQYFTLTDVSKPTYGERIGLQETRNLLERLRHSPVLHACLQRLL